VTSLISSSAVRDFPPPQVEVNAQNHALLPSAGWKFLIAASSGDGPAPGPPSVLGETKKHRTRSKGFRRRLRGFSIHAIATC